MGLLRRGLQGEPVRVLQQHLNVTQDGVFGQETYNALIQYQNENGLSPDGIAGPDTFNAMGLLQLVELRRPLRGQLVKKLQEGLGIDADGVFGHGTEEAVKRLQSEKGLEETGVADPTTLQYVAGFEDMASYINDSVVQESTPEPDPNAADVMRGAIAEGQLTEPEGAIEHVVHEVTDVASNIGKSIWNTVKSIF